MLYLRFILLVSWSVYLTSACLGLTHAEQEALELLNAPKTSDLTFLAHPKSSETVQLLRDIATGKVRKIESASFSDGLWARVVLLRFGDEFTMQDTVERYRKRFSDSGPDSTLVMAMEESKQPKLIPLLVSDFYKSESPAKIFKQGGWEGVSYSPVSVFSGIMIGRIIRKSDEFSPELKQWTWRMMSLLGRDPARFREVSKAWWTQNQALFAKEDYKGVQPIDFELPFSSSVQETSSDKASSAPLSIGERTPVQPSEPTAATPVPVDKSTASPMVMGETESAKQSQPFGFRIIPLAINVVVLLGVVMGAIYLIRRKSI
jgi:hypothetical protein